jgi:hypothetical protein
MSVIAEVTIPSAAFELGQILRVEGPTQVTLETMVPLGGRPTPFVRIRNDARESFERSVREHPSVNGIRLVDAYDDETLYSLNWEPSDASLLRKILDLDAVLLGASGDVDAWRLELRFPTHEALSAFQDYYLEENVDDLRSRVLQLRDAVAAPAARAPGDYNSVLSNRSLLPTGARY